MWSLQTVKLRMNIKDTIIDVLACSAELKGIFAERNKTSLRSRVEAFIPID